MRVRLFFNHKDHKDTKITKIFMGLLGLRQRVSLKFVWCRLLANVYCTGCWGWAVTVDYVFGRGPVSCKGRVENE